MSGRVIFHVDLNSFFASAELLKNSALQGQPVVVAGLHRRSVVSTANYEARAFGVHSAMPLHMALEKCPDLIVVQGDYAWYETLSDRFFQYLRKITPYVEPASIDEGYLDVTEIIKNYKRPLDLAWHLQKNLLEELRLPASIGVAPNKFLAKMASDMRKPMGITILRKHEISKKLWPLGIQDMWGIGKKTVPMLQANGIMTIGDLANEENEKKIMTLLGKHSYQFIQHARGQGSNRLEYNQSIKSISQSTTLDCDISDDKEIRMVFARLAKKLSTRAKDEGLKGSLISISIRYYDFTNMVRSTTIQGYTNDDRVLLEHALYLFDTHQTEKSIRHLGIGLASFHGATRVDQMNIFQTPKEHMNDVDEVVKELNKQLPDAHLTTLGKMHQL